MKQSNRTGRKVKLSMPATVVLTGVLVLVGGIVGVVVGMTDYTDHTERAEATVSNRVVDYDYEDGERQKEDVTIYVDYTVEGTNHNGVVLEGLDSDDFQEGQDLTVAYASGDPAHVVTPQSTEEGAYDFALYLGIATLVVGLIVLVTGGALMIVKKQRRQPF